MTTTIEPSTIQHVSPRSLLLERNIRDAKPDPDMVESIRAVGVLEPITAVLTDTGSLSVRYGFRRTLAAIEAGRDTVPVYVTGADESGDAAEIDRIIRQRDENTHRAGLTASEEAGAVAQLAAFGLSADQIAEQARIGRARVDSALRVTRSALASKAAERYEALTLDQAAAVAEFDDDAETAKALIVTAIERPEQFGHAVQRKRDDRDRARLVAEARTRLQADGVTVLDDSPGYDKHIDYLVDAETGEPLTEENHASCPGRACTVRTTDVWVDADGNTLTPEQVDALHQQLYDAALETTRAAATAAGQDPDDVDEDDVWESIDTGATQEQRGVPYWYCTNPAANGHKPLYSNSSTPRTPAAAMSDEERETARKARALVVENNKAWDSAETVRRDWLKEFATRKTPPKGTAAFIAEALAHDRSQLTDYRSTAIIAAILGTPTGARGHLDKLLKGATENRAQVLALVHMLGCYESTMTRDSWRGNGTNSPTGRYLRFLQSAGYTLSDVEKFAISSKAA